MSLSRGQPINTSVNKYTHDIESEPPSTVFNRNFRDVSPNWSIISNFGRHKHGRRHICGNALVLCKFRRHISNCHVVETSARRGVATFTRSTSRLWVTWAIFDSWVDRCSEFVEAGTVLGVSRPNINYCLIDTWNVLVKPSNCN